MLTSMLRLSEIGTSKPHFTSCMETTLLFEPHCWSQVSVALMAKACLRQHKHSFKKHTLQARAVQQTVKQSQQMSWSAVMLSLLSTHLISLTHFWLGLQSETNKHLGSSWKKITVRQLSDWAEFLRQRHPTPWGTRVCASQVYSSLLCLLHNESFTSPILSTAFLWRQQSEWKDFCILLHQNDTQGKSSGVIHSSCIVDYHQKPQPWGQEEAGIEYA